MIGMTAKRPIGITRGKSKVNGLGKPKERGNKPNGLTWQKLQPTGLQAQQEVKVK